MTRTRISQTAIRELMQKQPDMFAYEFARLLGIPGSFDEFIDDVWNDGVVEKSRVAFKTADQTVNNSATLVDDTELHLPVKANRSYILESFVAVNSSTTADVQFAFTAPAGASGIHLRSGVVVGATSPAASLQQHVGSVGTAVPAGGTDQDACLFPTGSVTTAGTAGVLRFRWAQNTADVSDTIVRAGSWLRLTEVS